MKNFFSAVYEKAKENPHFNPTITAARNFIYRHRCFSLLYKGLKSLINDGIRVTFFRVKRVLHTQRQTAALQSPFCLSEDERRKQNETKFSHNIKFSILVPVYNTPPEYLKEMIRSVQEQTYKNWELCLADGSDADHSEVSSICQRFAQKDHRILYKKLDKNGGISENTNQCIAMASGDYIGLFDHDDLLHPAALFEVVKVICEKDADFIYTDEGTFSKNPNNLVSAHFKPDYAPDTLRGNNYICHFTVFSRDLLKLTGGFRKECDGSQDHDLILRLTEKARHIVHIPKLLYFWRASPNSTSLNISSKPYVADAGRRAVRDSVLRQGMKCTVESLKIHPTFYHVRYQITGTPLISIVIPNKDHCEDLKRCLSSIFEKSTYQNFEILIADNGSAEPELKDYYAELAQNRNIKILHWDHPFNYSAINNFAVQSAAGEYLILLNSDTEVITPDWIQEMLMYAQRRDVGAVGAKLYCPNGTIAHAGIILGIKGPAGRCFYRIPKENAGYMGRLFYAQNLTAVAGTCLMVRKEYYLKADGFCEKLAAYNDVDFCLKLRKIGLLNVFTPFAELYHYESKNCSYEDTPEKQKRFQGEIDLFVSLWSKELAAGDPYYNPNLTLKRYDFSLK
ncbi:MAG: glycosyltransferase family 2 protein [Pyramidobacter sp.]